VTLAEVTKALNESLLPRQYRHYSIDYDDDGWDMLISVRVLAMKLTKLAERAPGGGK
jgi:hypothetical protein